MPASQTLGHVLTVSGSQMTVGFEHEGAEREIRIGDMVKVETAERTVVGTIAEVRFADEGGEQTRMFVVDLMGEIYQRGGEPEFTRGVSFHPAPGDAVLTADGDDLNVVYNESARANLAVGTLHHDPSRPACITQRQVSISPPLSRRSLRLCKG